MSTPADPAVDPVDDQIVDPADETDPDGADALGDPGKKALAAMKEREKTARAAAATEKAAREAIEAELARFRAAAEGREAEHAAELEKRAIEAAALEKANARIKSAEVRAAATGKLSDPEDAQRFLAAEIAALEVGDTGDVDRDAIASLIEGLLETRPYLAAQGRRFEGSPDGGARPPVPVKSLDEQIAEAEAAGDFATSRQLKAQRLVSLPTPS